MTAVLAGAALVLGTAPSGAAPTTPSSSSPSASSEPQATVELAPTTSSYLVDGTDLILAGEVTNSGSEPLGRANVTLRHSRDALEDRDDVRRVAADEEFRVGRRDVTHFVPIGDLEPGNSQPFTLTVPVDDLRLSDAGVYVVGVDVSATTSDGSRNTVAAQRTVLPYLDTDPLPQVPVSFLWPLSSTPSLLPDGRLIDDHLADELESDGRLGQLLTSAAAWPVGWSIDPDLLATVSEMADGYELRNAAGASVPGPGGDAAADWLATLRETIADDAWVAALPYADTDLVAVVRAEGADSPAVSAISATDEAVGSVLAGGTGDGPTVVPGVVAPVAGALDDETADAVAVAGARTIVLSGDAVEEIPAASATSPATRLGTEAGDLDVLLSDPGLDAALSATEQLDTGIAARQSLLAETAMVAFAARREETTPPALLGLPGHRWSPDPDALSALVHAWTSTPWIAAAPVPTPTSDAPTPEVTLDYTAADEAAEISRAQVDAAAALRTELDRFDSVLVEPDEQRAAHDEALLRGVSSAWRNSDGGPGYLAVVGQGVSSGLQQISVVVPEQLRLSSNSGRFPVEVSNALPVPVQVRLHFESSNPDRLEVADGELVEVPGGGKAQVAVEATATANGRVPVTVSLQTPSGEPFGAAHRFEIVATNYDTFSWFIVGGAAVLLFAAASFRIIRRVRTARRDARGRASGSPVEERQLPAASHQAPDRRQREEVG